MLVRLDANQTVRWISQVHSGITEKGRALRAKRRFEWVSTQGKIDEIRVRQGITDIGADTHRITINGVLASTKVDLYSILGPFLYCCYNNAAL